MRYRLRDGQLVPAHLCPRPERPRSDLPCPAIRSDHIDLVSMADGKRYDSKSAYYRSVREQGCEIVGDDPAYTDPRPPEPTTPPGLEQDIKTAIEQLEGRP